VQNFRNLKVWKRAHDLTLDVYSLTQSFPTEETFGLRSQMRRAAASIGINIAEGCGRRGDAEFGRYLQIAMGSASELEYAVLLARDLKLLPGPQASELEARVEEVKRMTTVLLRKLRAES
jgi:four helix bundle protein